MTQPANEEEDKPSLRVVERRVRNGAASGGTARTFDGCQITLKDPPTDGYTGFSICMVDLSENSGAGSALRWFYTRDRVLDGDWFYVDISPDPDMNSTDFPPEIVYATGGNSL